MIYPGDFTVVLFFKGVVRYYSGIHQIVFTDLCG